MTIIEDNGKLEVKSIKTALRLATPLGTRHDSQSNTIFESFLYFFVYKLWNQL